MPFLRKAKPRCKICGWRQAGRTKLCDECVHRCPELMVKFLGLRDHERRNVRRAMAL